MAETPPRMDARRARPGPGAGATRRRLRCALAALATLVTAGSAGAQSAPVPLGDPAYRDLAALRAAGALAPEPLHAQPYSRAAFARLVRHAATDGLRPRAAEALARLRVRFRAELDELAGGPRASATAGLVREGSVDATWTDSPPRRLYTQYDGHSNPLGENVDGWINPLLDGHGGRAVRDGWTTGVEALTEIALGRRGVAWVRPRLRSGEAEDATYRTRVTLREASVRLPVGGFALDVGRAEGRLGHGGSGGPLLSGETRPLDLVRVSSRRPVRLPWVLGALGPSSLQAFVADLGDERDVPGAKLVLFGMSALPHPNLEIGASLVNVQGGEGAPPATAWERFVDIVLWPVPGLSKPEISDKYFGVAGRLTLPAVGLEIHLDAATTDVSRRLSETLWDEAVWSGGARLSGLGPAGRIDVWIEGYRSGVRPYTHHQYTSGYTFEGRLLGAPTGPMATAWSAGVDWTGRTWALDASAHWERYRGDQHSIEPNRRRIHIRKSADLPDELRMRGLVEVAHRPAAGGIEAVLGLGAERVERFDFGPDRHTSFLARVQLTYRR